MIGYLFMIDCRMEAKGVIPIPVPINTACSALNMNNNFKLYFTLLTAYKSIENRQ